ncbi:GNAT family N-acetyltransferase [Pedobacter frigiditerrae]|uniref:GNAT family N-acetyltransferase n=1 Tax=Pedobacter frigiditerrae TaxID=2530452 RepID=A0A4R0MY74_9SPHI|nr:GNAT family N-acetyltransferase [Pedobacter frigiditerrae]TCC92235.1 GNAT family N-acetyltransferase [Pedobacter frigiditerrae]
MVKFIPTELTLGLRSKVLRNGMPLEDCVFPTDKVEGAFHLAFYVGDEIATIASFFPKNYKDKVELGYQLRGMATDTPFLGKGYGKQLVEFAIEYIKKTKAQYIWCNARTSAIKFYQKLGFDLVGEEFEIAGVGPHYEMILNLY